VESKTICRFSLSLQPKTKNDRKIWNLESVNRITRSISCVFHAPSDRGTDCYEKDLTKEQQEQFKASTTKSIRTYAFVLQIGPFIDIDLHKL